MTDGNDSSVGARIGRHAEQVKRFVRGKMSARPEREFGASDVVQSAVRKALTNKEQFRGASDAELFAWLRAIALNELRQKARRLNTKQRGGGVLRVPIAGALDDSHADARDVPAPDRSPSDHASLKEECGLLEQALQRLEPTTVRLLCLFKSGMSRREVAEELGWTQGKVAGEYRRGVEKLKTILEEFGIGDAAK